MSVEHEKASSSGIKIVDKRRFTSSGEVRADAPAEAPAPAPAPVAAPPRHENRPDPRSSAPAASRSAPESAGHSGMEFLQFIASLATTAMAALGMMPEGHQGRQMQPNPEMALEYIEVIAMLEEKTHGNLTAQEAATLKRLLSDLRMQYVEVTRRRK